MAKRMSVEEQMARMKELADLPVTSENREEIKKGLASASNLVVAKAAKTAAKLGLKDTSSLLVDAFHRFLKNPVKTDPGCRAKMAVVEALTTLRSDVRDLFRLGAHYVQKEPVYKPPVMLVDMADELRGMCAFGLYQTGDPDILFELTTLLMDEMPQARRAAVRVLAEAGTESAELLLRLKLMNSDAEPEVIADCFNALIKIHPDRSIPFVVKYIKPDNLIMAEDAALAIGSSRKEVAFQVLKDFHSRAVEMSYRNIFLLPIALTRCEEAFEYLLDVLGKERKETAVMVLKALKVMPNTESRMKKIKEAVCERDDPAIERAWKEEFPLQS